VDKSFTGSNTSSRSISREPRIAYAVSRGRTRDLKLARFNGVTWSTQVVQAGSMPCGSPWRSTPPGATIAYSDDANLDGRIDTLKFARGTHQWIREVVDASPSGEALATFVSLAYDRPGTPITYSTDGVPRAPVRVEIRVCLDRRADRGARAGPYQYNFGTSLAFDGAARMSRSSKARRMSTTT